MVLVCQILYSAGIVAWGHAAESSRKAGLTGGCVAGSSPDDIDRFHQVGTVTIMAGGARPASMAGQGSASAENGRPPGPPTDVRGRGEYAGR